MNNGTGQRASDASNGLNARHYKLAEFIHGGRFGTHDHVIRTGDVVGHCDPANGGNLTGHRSSLANFGLNQDVGLNHGVPPLSSDVHAWGETIALVTINERLPVSQVGEFNLIAALTKRLPMNESVLVGPGDDAAVLRTSGDVVVTTDCLVEGVHFRLDWSSAIDVGVKSAAANLADVVAMGAHPIAVVVAIAVPSTLPASWVVDVTDGIRMECERIGASVVGGDVSSSERIMVSLTALGTLNGRPPTLRSGAKVGDVIAVAGDLGVSAAGLAVLRRGFTSPRDAVSRHRRPHPPYDIALAAIPNAMIDVSDGLLVDAGHIAKASKVTMSIDTSLLPRAQVLASVAAALNVDPLEWILTGGEDHAFLATFSGQVPDGFTAIGRVLPHGDDPVLVDGVPRTGGHQHFTA